MIETGQINELFAQCSNGRSLKHRFRFRPSPDAKTGAFMDWITDEIAIGDYREAQDADALRLHGFGAILGLISTLRKVAPAALGVRRIEVVTLLDGPGNSPPRFLKIVELLQELVAETPPVLVHCRAGWSRSPAVVAGYLMRTQGLSVEEAIRAVAAKRAISLAPELRTLLEHFNEP